MKRKGGRNNLNEEVDKVCDVVMKTCSSPDMTMTFTGFAYKPDIGAQESNENCKCCQCEMDGGADSNDDRLAMIRI